MSEDATLLVLAIALPAGVSLAAFLLPLRAARLFVALSAPVHICVVGALGLALLRTQEAIVAPLGGWLPPLGIALRADGLSAAMLAVTALIMASVILFSLRQETLPDAPSGERRSYAFWVLLPGVWASLNTVFLANDLFTLYVALELLTFSAVPLAALEGRAETIAAALRYLLFALAGAALYLLGVGLLYGNHGTLDITLLTGRLTATPIDVFAIGLMTAGLLAKTALLPFHLWLPPAHAGAPAAASAILSSLIIKGSYFVLLRVWLDVARGLPLERPALLLAALGAVAILLGSGLALRQARLKLLVAYSTVAQIGYLFLLFPIVAAAAAAGNTEIGAAGVTGAMLQAVSHALAKGAMFLAVGLIILALGHDRLDGLRGLGRALPMTVAAFLIAGLSLMGLPPSGGFWAKWLLLKASITGGQWWWALVVLTGGLLAGGYVYRVVNPALTSDRTVECTIRPVPRALQAIPLFLAIGSLLLGLMALAPPQLLLIGRMVPGAEGAAP